jgi:hypothetical protein
MRTFLLCLFLLIFSTPAWSWSWFDDEVQPVTIADPFIEMHTGPGSGYPIFHVVDRGETVYVVRRQTDWFKLRTDSGKEGWTPREQLVQTLSETGEQVEIKDATQAEFERRKWELGATGGQLGGATSLSIYGGYAFSKNLSAEVTLSEALGTRSSSFYVTGSLLAQPFPEWRYSPFFSIGTGMMETRPRSTLVSSADSNNQFSQVGIGLRTYLTRRFIFRAEVNEMMIYSASNDRDSNEGYTEWKIGFGVFF